MSSEQPPYEMQDAYVLTKDDWLKLREHLTIGCTNQKTFLDTLRPHPTPAQIPILERYARERGEKVFLIYEGEVNAIKAFCARHELKWNDAHIRNRNDLQTHDAAIARKAREDVLKVITTGKSALYEIEPDGHWNQILQAKMDVLCWIEESLRTTTPHTEQAGNP